MGYCPTRDLIAEGKEAKFRQSADLVQAVVRHSCVVEAQFVEGFQLSKVSESGIRDVRVAEVEDDQPGRPLEGREVGVF